MTLVARPPDIVIRMTASKSASTAGGNAAAWAARRTRDLLGIKHITGRIRDRHARRDTPASAATSQHRSPTTLAGSPVQRSSRTPASRAP
jgi:hypothetical protein